MGYWNNTDNKKVKIWQTSNFLILVTLGILCIVFALLLFLCIFFERSLNKKLFVFIIIEILCVSLFSSFMKLTMKEVRKHSNLIQNGMIVKGVIKNVSEIIEGFEIKAVYYDKEAEKEYIYKQSKRSNYNFNWIKQKMLINSEINILLDKDDKQNGLILLDDYCKGLNENRSRFDYPRISELEMNEEIDKGLKRVQGRLLKESLSVWGRNGVLEIVEADIFYCNKKTMENMLFKGRGYARWSAYLKARQSKEEIVVDVVYCEKDRNNYVVYLEEALERL